jgi:hypothetical protein
MCVGWETARASSGKRWRDKTIVNRDDDLRNWVKLFRMFRKTIPDLKIYAYANNHYQGHGTGTVRLL